MFALVAAVSLALEMLVGYPERLFTWIGHPVTWIGRLISFLDKSLNRATDSDRTRRLSGLVALIVIVGVPAMMAFAVERVLLTNALGFLVVTVLATTLLAQKSLADHVEAVANALDTGGLTAGRQAVSKIVGRDPESLDEAAVSRAAIESLAENFSDGVVAPAFWLAVGGLAGGVAYKAANTADSMIGHRTPRHEAFGWAAARFDDLVNLPASRLTALLIVAAAAILPGMDWRTAWQAVWRDARKHRSPNAGWPEAAMAGALGIALSGPRSYGGVMGDYAYMGEGGRREVTAADIRRALRLFWMADVLLMVGLAVIGIAVVA
jgi:adenosylcobinamide-phosphate synthase